VLAALLAAAAPSGAQRAPTAEAVLGPGGAPGTLLGYAVALDGDRALVGAPSDDGDASAGGTARVYHRRGGRWTEEAVLSLHAPAEGDYFGISVALDGDRALVGAYGRGGRRGAAVLFRRTGTGWAEEATLTLDGAAVGDQFGVSVALDGDRALVGAHGRDGTRGAAVLFERSGGAWVQTDTLTLSDAAPGARVGWSVALDGDRALVGAYGHGEGRGTAVLFERSESGWAERARFDGAGPGDNAGVSVALDGGHALVGAPFAEGGARRGGTATVYAEGRQWAAAATLTASDPQPDDYFGWSVALDGDRALVGVRLDDGGGANSGGARTFHWDGAAWTEAARVDGEALGDNAGLAVALDGDRALVGAPYTGGGRGAAHVFALAPLAAPCALGVPLAVGALDVGSGVGDERVELTTSARVTLGGCRIVALDPHTRTVTFAADAVGTVRSGAPFAFATAGGDQALPPSSIPDGAGAVALVAGPVSAGDAVETVFDRLVAGAVYEGPGEVARLGGGQDVGAFEAAFDRLLATSAEAASPRALGLAVAPNPTAGRAQVAFELGAPADVRVAVYDALGREVAVLAEGARGAGLHRAAVEGGALPAGLYVVRVVAAGRARTARLTVVR
jgi:hypothetical protein